jgi:hypothetical protein
MKVLEISVREHSRICIVKDKTIRKEDKDKNNNNYKKARMRENKNQNKQTKSSKEKQSIFLHCWEEGGFLTPSEDFFKKCQNRLGQRRLSGLGI